MNTTQQQVPSPESDAPEAAFSLSFAKRLASYTAAASLGAFSYGEAARADIVHVDLGSGIAHNTANSFSSLDLDSNGTVDFLFGRSTSAYGGVRLIVYGHPGSPVGGGFVPPFDPTLPANEISQNFTNSPAKGNAYYIRSFEFGNSIGSGGTMPMHQIGPYSPFVNFTGAVSTNPTNFGNPNAPQYWGFGLNIEGEIHYGWGRLSTIRDGGGVWTATLHEYAYQSEPGVPILAGELSIPEPTTLALLAAGGGGLALAGRRKRRV